MAGRSRVILDVRREELYESLISFFGFTQVFRVAVCEGGDVSVAEWAGLSSLKHVPVTAAAKHQFLLLLSSFCFRACGTYLDEIIRERKLIDRRPIRVLEYQFEPAVIEWRSRRALYLRDPFTQSLLRQLQCTMMAVRIVAGASKEHARGPRAAGLAHVKIGRASCRERV